MIKILKKTPFVVAAPISASITEHTRHCAKPILGLFGGTFFLFKSEVPEITSSGVKTIIMKRRFV